jgi:iron(III) transport system substrate-binding protein
MRRGAGQHLLRGADDAFHQARGPEVDGKVGIVWPNQAEHRHAHQRLRRRHVKHAPNKEAAVKFLEYLASDDAQRYFADGNNEWPVVVGLNTNNPALDAMGKFKADTLPISALAKNVVAAQKLLDRAGYR